MQAKLSELKSFLTKKGFSYDRTDPESKREFWRKGGSPDISFLPKFILQMNEIKSQVLRDMKMYLEFEKTIKK